MTIFGMDIDTIAALKNEYMKLAGPSNMTAESVRQTFARNNRKEEKGMNIIQAFDAARKQGKDKIRRELELVTSTSDPCYKSLYIYGLSLHEFLGGCESEDLRATNWEVEKVQRKVEGVATFPLTANHNVWIKLSPEFADSIPNGAKVVITWEE